VAKRLIVIWVGEWGRSREGVLDGVEIVEEEGACVFGSFELIYDFCLLKVLHFL